MRMIRAPGVNPKTIGHIKGVPVGKTFENRQKCSAYGVHAPWQAGIHGTAEDGAYSVVLSGGYPDDVDHGDFITYTGSGGRTYGTADKKAWEGEQTGDQTWTMGNLALKRSFELKRPVRVIRGSGLGSRYAPAEGYRYDGLYMVVKAERALGKQGFMMCKFEFSRLPHQPPLPTPGLTFVDTKKRKRARRESEDEDGSSSSEEEWFSEPVASSSNVHVEDIPPPRQRSRAGPQSALMRKVQSKAITHMRRFKLENPPAKRPVTKALKTESDSARCPLVPLVDPNLKEEIDKHHNTTHAHGMTEPTMTIDASEAEGTTPEKRVIHITVPPRWYLIPGTAFIAGAAIGVVRGGQTESLRFLAENAHRPPTTVEGWYFYNKTKNYRIMLAGLKSGGWEAAKLAALGVGWVGIEEGVERAGLGDVREVIAGVGTAAMFSGACKWNIGAEPGDAKSGDVV
ncbi:hypothetical protein EYR36_006103 [Pleurotus pulmonarius]|nr:hypothetical protein EYR36_006103 [Pleurotus pulmonarius]